MSRMHNPAHPGEVLREWLPEDMTVTQAAKELQVSRVTLSKVLNGKAGVTAGMALRLSAWLGTSADLWMGMQSQWDLWQAEQLPKAEHQAAGKTRRLIEFCRAYPEAITDGENRESFTRLARHPKRRSI
jgi:addiction module HigA family antidote